MRTIWMRLRGLFGRQHREDDLATEIRAHLDQLAEEHTRRGLSAEDARAAARRDFGGVDQVKEEYRDQLGIRWLDTLSRDLRFGARSLARTPGVTVAIVVTLAVGVGANAAVFSMVNAVALKPFAYADADRLVVVHEIAKHIHMAPVLPVNAVHAEEWRRDLRSFDQIAIMRDGSVNLTGSGEPERLTIGRASANLFAMLGVRPQLGRLFQDSEDCEGRDAEVILTDSLWRRRFAADPAIVGRKILLDDRPFVVVGVLPAAFRFPRFSDLYAMPVTSATPDLWKPFGLRDAERSLAGDFNYACIAKLRPGVTIAQAASELAGVQSRIDGHLDEPLGLGAVVVPLARQVTSRVRAGLWLALAASAVVLFIACVNVASLLLGRLAAREREFAIRRAIGATRARLIAQLLVECAMLSALASAIGLLLAWAAARVVLSWAPADLPQINAIGIDGRVIAFTAAAAILATSAIVAVPAWRFTAREPLPRAARRAAASATRRTLRTRSILVASEISISTACLVAALLLMRGFAQLMSVDKGFSSEHVMLVDLNLTPQRYPDLKNTTAFVRTMLDAVSSAPGVVSAGVVSQPPLAGEGGNNALYRDGTSVPLSQTTMVDFRPSSARYFATMGVPLIRGRLFDEHDGARLVAVISESAAARVWPGDDPLGRTLHLRSPDSPPIAIVGIVGDVRGISLSDPPTPTVYLPYWQRAFNRNRVTLAIRTAMDGAAVGGDIRRVVHRIDPELPVPAFRTMTEVVDASTASRRFQRNLVIVFALLALLLVGVGTYGVVSYSVTQRTHEIGIRVALGALRARVVGNVLADATRVAGVGLVFGVPLAIAVAYAMRSLLYGVSPADVMSIAGACAALMVTSVAAAVRPALRASRVDPAIALRQE